MGQIRLLLLAGPDLPQEGVRYLDALLQHLEWEWFRVRLLGEPAVLPDAAGLSGRESVRPGPGWFAGGRELGRLRALFQDGDVIDCHGYQALSYAARAGLDPARTVYTRHYRPKKRSERQRETWLLGRVACVLAPDPDLADGAGPRVRMAPVLASPSGESPERDAAKARLRLGLSPAWPAAVVYAGPGCDRPLLEGLVAAFPEIHWLPLRGPAGGHVAVPDAPTALAASDVVLFPMAHALEDPGLLDGALGLGCTVVAARVPGVVGRLRCLSEGYILPVSDFDTWHEVLGALLVDPELREVAGVGARRAFSPLGPGQAVRVVESLYAGVLMAATGACPVCQ